MAVNRPTGDNARKGAVKKHTQLKKPLTKTSTKRNKKAGSSWPSRRARRSLRASGGRSNGPVLYRSQSPVISVLDAFWVCICHIVVAL